MTATDVAQAVHVGPRCILVLTSDLNAETAPQVTRFAREALAGTAVSDVVIDVSAVTAIDPAGILALVAIRDVAVANDAAIRICGASGEVVNALATAGLSTMFGLPTETSSSS